MICYTSGTSNETRRKCANMWRLQGNLTSMFTNPTMPISRAEECFHAVNGDKKFTKLDLAQAYNQIMLDEALKQLTTINTHCGLYS